MLDMETVKKTKAKGNVKSFGDWIRYYEKEGHGTRESIEMAYCKTGRYIQPKIKKTPKNKPAKMDE